MMRPLALCLAGAVMAMSHAAVAEPLALDATAMRQLADKAIRAGYGEDALDIIAALLARDPQDATALILQAQAYRLLGELPKAEAAAREAFASAKTDNGRFGAAMVLAQTLSLQDRRIEAQLWLRRAAQTAPNERTRAVAERDFNLVRADTPLRLTFALSASPSSNVNNGARDAVFELPSGYVCPTGCLGGATGAALALSGIEGAIGMGAEYRLHDSQSAQGLMSLTLSHGFVVLSDEAQQVAPLAQASDFAMTSLDLGLTEKVYFAQSGAIVTGAVNLGQVWYGGAALTGYLAADLGLSLPMGERTTLSGGLSHQLQVFAQNGEVSGHLTDLRFGAQTRLPSGDQIGVQMSHGMTAAPDPFARNTRSEVQVTWSAAKPVLGMDLSATAQIGKLDYAESFYAFAGRHDTKAGLTVTTGLNSLEYMGFVPVLTVNAGQNWSNIGLYDSTSLGIGLGITSKF